MARFNLARIRYHVFRSGATAAQVVQDRHREGRQSSSLDDGSAIQQQNTSKRPHLRLKEKLGLKVGNSPKPRQMTVWRPVALHRTSLAAFIMVFCSMLAALEVLKQYSDRHHGLTSTAPDRHYFWTYGPTAGESPVHVHLSSP